MRFIKRQTYKIHLFIQNWIDRKIIETRNRELKFIESMMLIFVAFPVWYLTNPYDKRRKNRGI